MERVLLRARDRLSTWDLVPGGNKVTPEERDRRIEALAAERVLGWVRSKDWSTRWTDSAGEITSRACEWYDEQYFGPLTSIADAFALLEAHPEWQWEITRLLGQDCIRIRIWPAKPHPDAFFDSNDFVNPPRVGRVITYAALRAVGAGKELDELLEATK